MAAPPLDPDAASVLDKRQRHVGPNVALSYDVPLHIVRGQGARLYDAGGRPYLDCVNNVAHVGHSNPQVTRAMCAQLAELNTNCRYLSTTLSDYCEALAATLPDHLQVAYMTCSGSEANDLALRMAATRAGMHPRDMHIAVLDGAYHGHLASLIDASPYKFYNPGGGGRPAHVHVLPLPDAYRGTGLDGRAAARAAIQAAAAAGARLCAFIAESIPSCAGQVVLPPSWLADVYAELRAAGVTCIADEVQVGFGRVGSAFWGFQLGGPGVRPDIVTLGKPIGNGFPMAAAVTTRDMAAAFAAGGMEYFATCGGCTAAGAVGLAVLGALRSGELQAAAAATGAHLLERLRCLQQAHSDVLGDVRGVGLMVGLEWVADPVSKLPAPALARWVKERAREAGVLLSCDGMLGSVIKIKPPMVFGVAEADVLVDTLLQVLKDLAIQVHVKAALIAESVKAVEARAALWEELGNPAAQALHAALEVHHRSSAAAALLVEDSCTSMLVGQLGPAVGCSAVPGALAPAVSLTASCRSTGADAAGGDVEVAAGLGS